MRFILLYTNVRHVPRPLRGATRPYVPAGTATEICVSTRAFPRAGITLVSALDHSQFIASKRRERNEPVEIVPRSKSRATRGQACLLRVTLDEEAGDGREVRLIVLGRHFAFLELRSFDFGHGQKEKSDGGEVARPRRECGKGH